MSLGIGVSMRRPPHARIRLGWVLLALLVTRSSPIDIATLQTAGDAGTGTDCFPSPHSGSAVTTQGTVTSVHRDSFTMQSAAAAWSGIAIHTGLGHALLSVVRVGDDVWVKVLPAHEPRKLSLSLKQVPYQDGKLT